MYCPVSSTPVYRSQVRTILRRFELFVKYLDKNDMQEPSFDVALGEYAGWSPRGAREREEKGDDEGGGRQGMEPTESTFDEYGQEDDYDIDDDETEEDVDEGSEDGE